MRRQPGKWMGEGLGSGLRALCSGSQLPSGFDSCWLLRLCLQGSGPPVPGDSTEAAQALTSVRRAEGTARPGRLCTVPPDPQGHISLMRPSPRAAGVTLGRGRHPEIQVSPRAPGVTLSPGRYPKPWASPRDTAITLSRRRSLHDALPARAPGLCHRRLPVCALSGQAERPPVRGLRTVSRPRPWRGGCDCSGRCGAGPGGRSSHHGGHGAHPAGSRSLF